MDVGSRTRYLNKVWFSMTEKRGLRGQEMWLQNIVYRTDLYCFYVKLITLTWTVNSYEKKYSYLFNSRKYFLQVFWSRLHWKPAKLLRFISCRFHNFIACLLISEGCNGVFFFCLLSGCMQCPCNPWCLTHIVYDALEIHLELYRALSFSLVIIYTTFLYILRKTEKSVNRRHLQRPKPNLMRSSGRRETPTQDQMEAKTSPTVANAGEKVRKRNVA